MGQPLQRHDLLAGIRPGRGCSCQVLDAVGVAGCDHGWSLAGEGDGIWGFDAEWADFVLQ